VSYNPTPELAFQVSHGYLRSPEQLEPQTRVRRTTASAIYQTTVGGYAWGTTVGWARNDDSGPTRNTRLPGAFIESTFVVADRHTVFGRYEQVDKDELFEQGEPLDGRSFVVRRLSLGYIYDFAASGPIRWGLGGVVGIPRGPSTLDPYYGRDPMSYMVFLQGRIVH
jgi:hypothetical protein